MAHRVNFKVYRLGKTIKWNFSAPLINVQKTMRLNYIMSHWVKRALFDCNIKIFKFFYSIAPDFPVIKIIGYRKLYIKSKKFFNSYNFTLRSSNLLDSNKLFALPANKISNKLIFYRQREKNRKLISIREPSKQRKASYKNVLLPLLESRLAHTRILNFFFLELKSAISYAKLFSCVNPRFSYTFILNTFLAFSLFGSINIENAKNRVLKESFKLFMGVGSYACLVFKDLLQVDSMGWFKFIISYIHLFLNTYNFSKNEVFSNKFDHHAFFYAPASFFEMCNFFFLKKSFFVLRLILKNYPKTIFLGNGKNILSHSSFLLNIIRFYFFIAKNKSFETRPFDFYSTAPLVRNRPSYYLLLKLKLIATFSDKIAIFKIRYNYLLRRSPRKYCFNFYTHILGKVVFCFRNLLSEINTFWTRDLSLDYKESLNTFELTARLSSQIVLFLEEKTNIKCPPMAEFFEFSLEWWRSRFFSGRTFNYDFLYRFVLSRAQNHKVSAAYLLENFGVLFSNSTVYKYFQSWSYIFLNKNLDSLAFNIIEEGVGLKRKKKYVRPIKIFADIDNALAVKTPAPYQDLLKSSLRSSSVFSFSDYELKLRLKTRHHELRSKSDNTFKKLLDNLFFLVDKTKNEKIFFLILTESGRTVQQVVASLADKFRFKYNKILDSCSTEEFFYCNRAVGFFEKSLTFWRAAQRESDFSSYIFKNSFFKIAVFSSFLNIFYNFFKFKKLADFCFLGRGRYQSVGSVEVAFSNLNAPLFNNSVVFLKKSKPDSFVFINTLSSHLNPSIAPLGVFKKNKGFKNFMRPLFSKVVSAFFSPFFIDFNLLNLNFLLNSPIFFFATLASTPFKIFKKQSLILRRNWPSLSPIFFLTISYLADNSTFRRQSALSSSDFFNLFSILPEYGSNLVNLPSEVSLNKFKLFNLIDHNRPYLKHVDSLNKFFQENYYLLNLSATFFKIFGVFYEIMFYPIYRVFQDNARFQFLISQAGDFLRAYVSRNPYVLYWLNEFIVIFYASIATRSVKALSQFMAERFKKEYYWNQSAAFMFSVVRSIVMQEFGILGLRIGFHGKFGGQERAYRLYKIWGANPCLRNGILTGSHSSSRCHSRYGITDIHIWLVYY